MAEADLVLEGGGVKGLALAGAVARLMEEGYGFPRVAGTSAGAIVGALVAAGIPAPEIRAVMEDLDYHRVPDRGWPGIPYLSEGISLLRDRGAFEGDYIRDWLYKQLKKLGVETFADLRRQDPKGDVNLRPEQRYKLVVMVTDVTCGRLLHLPWDYQDLFHLDPDQQFVADAVRASMSIPLFFDPQVLRDPVTGAESTLVDGGVLSNFPLEVFDRTDHESPRWPTFGVKLLPALPQADSTLFPVLSLPTLPPVRLLESVVATAIVGRDQTYLARPCVHRRTMTVNTDSVGITEFSIGQEKREELFRNGGNAAQDFLDRWDWAAYLADCRSSATAPATRRRRRAGPSAGAAHA
jgi:NTE family protein